MKDIYVLQNHNGILTGAYGLTIEDYKGFCQNFKIENFMLTPIDSCELIRMCCECGGFKDNNGNEHYIDSMNNNEIRKYIKDIIVTDFPFNDIIFFGNVETFYYEGYDKQIEKEYNVIYLKFNKSCIPYLGGK